MELIYKTAEVWKHLRPPLARWAKAQGFKRLASSPPTYSRELSRGFATLFAVGSRGGVDAQAVGGTFTVALQIGEAAMPGVDHCADVDLRTTRLPELFSSSNKARALAIHNDVVQKRRKPTSSHYLNDIYSSEQIDQVFLQPLQSWPDSDPWFAFVDDTDIRIWADFFAEHLSAWLQIVVDEASGKFYL